MKPETTLKQAIQRYEKIIAERDALTAKANAIREAAIREAAQTMTRREIAEVAGLSFQRVQQIVKPGRSSKTARG